jgi:hypothetical protein
VAESSPLVAGSTTTGADVVAGMELYGGSTAALAEGARAGALTRRGGGGFDGGGRQPL